MMLYISYLAHSLVSLSLSLSLTHAHTEGLARNPPDYDIPSGCGKKASYEGTCTGLAAHVSKAA